MRAAALFAVAYGFPVSQCKTTEEALGLLANIRFALSASALMTSKAVQAASSAAVRADLLEGMGADPKQVAAMHIEAIKEQAAQASVGAQRW